MPRWSWGLLQASDLLTPLVPGPTHPRPCPVVALPPLKLPLEDLQNREGRLSFDWCSCDWCVYDNAFSAGD